LPWARIGNVLVKDEEFDAIALESAHTIDNQPPGAEVEP
jgi:hypothetical protein